MQVTFEVEEEGYNLKQALWNVEHDLLVDAVKRFGPKPTHIAAGLCLKRTTLVMKLKRFGLLGGPKDGTGTEGSH